MLKSLTQYLLDSPFSRNTRDVVMLFVGGSELHGAKVEGTDDHDIYGVYLETPPEALGIDALSRSHQHYVWSTAGDDRKNSADDVDITLYSLQKWAYLACKGNVTILHFLFAPYDDPSGTKLWEQVRDQKNIFLAQSHIDSLLKFSDDQLARVAGRKGRGKKGQRPELEAVHGYDTKAAMHAIRILHEAEELLTCGTLTLPGKFQQELIRIREGKWSLAEVESHAAEMRQRCQDSLKTSELPSDIDREKVSKFIADLYLKHWQATGS
jgi:hypothetical protein